MPSGYTELNTFRYERKFVATGLSPVAAEMVVKQNHAFFAAAYSPRVVNNIYFDTPGLDCYFDNLFGNGQRWKCRIRWYGDRFGKIYSPILEFKIKKGLVGTKKSFHLPEFDLPMSRFNASDLLTLIRNADLPEEIRERIMKLQPVLLNSYKRSYFISNDKKFRITVDSELEYYNVRSNWNSFVHPYSERLKTVVELKYDEMWNDEAKEITNEFPFRLDKNSKFVAGMSHYRSEIAE